MPALMPREDATTPTTEDILPTGVTTIDGQPSATSTSSPHDPLLAIMPKFIYSMPAQIVVDGINLSLVSILAIQLVFTAQYHFPLSRKNYLLQLVSVLMLLITVAVHLHIVLSKLSQQSHVWPYMFSYIGVQIPPQDGSWTLVQEGFYLLMRAMSTSLVHLTHIQFLTLLFPSALEARLILWMLGPLALVASGMEFTALSSENDVKTSDLGDAIRNICNSALFLLYTSALLIWGVLVNRGRAWRTDGGTAAFGGGAVGLAIINTSISFVEIAYDRLWWLPDICWTLTIWQSWLGFWWWVGSGMGIGEVEDRAERQERRRKREAKLERKRIREERNRHKTLLGSSGASAAVAAASNSLSGNSDAFFSKMRRLKVVLIGEGRMETSSLNRRSKSSRTTDVDVGQPGEERIELDRLNEGQDAERMNHLTSIAVDNGELEGNHEEGRTVAASSSDTQPTTSGAATSTTGWFNSMTGFFAEHQPGFVRTRMRRLRMAHEAAAQKAATEQSVLRDQVLNRQSASQAPGLRTMMSGNRASQPVPTNDLIFGSNNNNNNDDDKDGQDNSTTLMHSLTTDSSSTSEHLLSVSALGKERQSSTTSNPSFQSDSILRNPVTVAPLTGAGGAHQENEWVDDEADQLAEASIREEIPTTVNDEGDSLSAREMSSWSWRGGLRTLRRRDHTKYD
ncbi:hypothetical protein CBS101457_005995 [Exobasidium rhododendri]|nr:hypothetical protein CBS101457_005995 [Exobasidium rhododendri]